MSESDPNASPASAKAPLLKAAVILWIAIAAAVLFHALAETDVSLLGDRARSERTPSAVLSEKTSNNPDQNQTTPGNVPPGPNSLLPALAQSTAALPSHVFIPVGFIAQAPLGIWSAPWNNACEEAAALMAVRWARHEAALTPDEAATAILAQVRYEDANFGYHSDTNLTQTKKLITRFFKYPNVEIFSLASPDDIRRELAAGNIVIVPAAGSLLGNPHFVSPPPYHMLLINGYDDATHEFIVEEPGTRFGENYRYRAEVLWNAIHDWTGDETTVQYGQKGMIVVHPVRETLHEIN